MKNLTKSSKLPKKSTPLVRKELNQLGKTLIFGVYTLVVVLTVRITGIQEDSLSANQLSLINQKQQEILKSLREKPQQEDKNAGFDQLKRDIERRLEDKLEKKRVAQETKSLENRIITLKNELLLANKKLSFSKILLGKQQNKAKQKSEYVYNQSNYNLLYKRHEIELKNLKVKHESKEEAFAALYNIEENKDKWLQFQKELKLEYIETKEKLSQLRRNFRKNRYISSVDN